MNINIHFKPENYDKIQEILFSYGYGWAASGFNKIKNYCYKDTLSVHYSYEANKKYSNIMICRGVESFETIEDINFLRKYKLKKLL